jgi:hypothetical protein
MNKNLSQKQSTSLLEDAKTYQKLSLNYRRNKEQDNTELMDEAASRFRYEDCRSEFWNPEPFSLLYGTPVWEQSTPAQRLVLNQLYWVAYYSQIISAEIATILLNQTSAAGLNSMEDFRLVCDTLDLETGQERAHIHAFKTVAEEVEAALFGERLFTYPMRSMFCETMIFSNTDRIREFWRKLQLQAFALLSSGNAFIGCQYFTVRGLRTLNGKMIQHALSQYYLRHPNKDNAPIPSKISYYHFLDESFHFNSSGIISHDVLHSLRPPTRFESWVANRALMGCQKDHYNFSVAIKGIFWYDPALFSTIYKLFRSPVFRMEDQEAKQMIAACFTKETDALHESYKIHRTALESYKAYLDPIGYVSRGNKAMSHMDRSSIEGYLQTNREALRRFLRTA